MFQVDPERVMFATGAPKSKTERREGRMARQKESQGSEEASEEGAEEKKEEQKSETEAENKEAEPENTRETLKTLMAQAKGMVSTDKQAMPAKQKQELRGFQKAVRRVLSRSESSTILTGNLESQFSELLTLLKAKRAEKGGKKNKNAPKSTSKSESDAGEIEASETRPGEKLTEAFQQAAENPDEEVDTSELDDEEINTLKKALTQMRDNPIDSTKPYATPWRPRDYMGAFAFIPRYLEVNQNICAAVYLRHPVARPGFSEVPSPFSESINTAAFAWYLRRR